MSFKINPIQPGDLIADQQIALLRQSGFPKIAGYDIECEIGHGGMATVYRAVQQSLNRPVAIKILATGGDDDPDFMQRIKKEGEILAQLSHPSIMTIYDIGFFEDNRVYLSVEYLSGGTLKDNILRGSIPFENAIEIAQSIAKALRYAHQRGVIHRDVKPSNIMFNEEGAPVLTDFGIARAKQSKTIHTLTGLIIGSPGYMSPEQAMGETATIQSDLYGLGVVLYEMLTGKPIYSADNTLAILLKHINDPIPALPKHYAKLQPVFNKLVAKRSQDRYNNADEFLDALDEVIYQKTTPKLNKDFSPEPSLKLNFLLPRKSGLFIGAAFVSTLVISLAAVHLFFSESATNPIESAKPATAIQPPPPAFNTTPPVQIETGLTKKESSETTQQHDQEQQRQNQLLANQLWAQAQLSLNEGLLSIALVNIEQGLLAVPDHKDLLQLREQTHIRLAEQEKQEARRKAEKAEAERKAAAEVQRKAAEAEAQRKAAAAETERKAVAEAQRKAAEAESERKAAIAAEQKKAQQAEAAQKRQEKAAKEKELTLQRLTQSRAAKSSQTDKDAELKKVQEIKNAVDALNRSLDR